MKIILTQMVPNLGSLGDEVQVKDGYARNYLLPKRMAIPAGGKNAKALQHRRQFLDTQRQGAIEDARGEAEKVTSLELVLKARSGTGGRLFGSITNRDLQAAIAEQNFELDRKSIVLHTPVKSLGTFGATLKLHTDVKVDITFRVESTEIVAEEVSEDAAEEVTGEKSPDAAAGEEGAGTEKVSAESTVDSTMESAESSAPPDAATEATVENSADAGASNAPPETDSEVKDQLAEAAPASEETSGEAAAEDAPSTTES